MASRPAVRLSSYGQNLDQEARQHYEEKIVECGGVDPLLLTDAETSSISLCKIDLVPRVDESDIKDYLVRATGYLTNEKFKAVESLESHNYLTSGFVQEPKLRQVGDDLVIVVSKVNDSQALSARQLEPWLLIRRDGPVKQAHCTCMTGLGEACSHIGAVLYYINAVSQFNIGQTSADTENARLPPFIRNVPCAPIDLASASAKKRRLDSGSLCATEKKERLVDTPTEEEDFSSAEPRVAVLPLTEGDIDGFVPATERYPSALLRGLARDRPEEWDKVMEECHKFSASFAVEESVCSAVEAETRAQAKSATWFAFRAGRVTASNARAACRTSPTQPAVSLIKKMCYPEASPFSTRATDWGHTKEDVARKQYVSEMLSKHVDFECTASGLHICPKYPFLASSPDGIISCKCCGKGTLEIYCPYTAKCIAEVASGKRGILNKGPNGDKRQLNRDHEYFHQVQVQMLTTGLSYCDFVVWTVQDCHIERIKYDRDFCSEIVSKCKLFFEQALLPEILFKHWTQKPKRGDGDVGFCYCGGTKSGTMAECHNAGCKGKFFHLACAKLKCVPKKKNWLCKNCRPQHSGK